MRQTLLVLAMFTLFFSCKDETTTTTTKQVGVIVFGPLEKPVRDSALAAIKSVYGFEVVFLGERKVPQPFFVNIKSPRYRADSIIAYLKRIKPDTIDYLVGLTAFDISTTKTDGKGNILTPEYKDWGIFGLGYMPGPACVISSYRLKTNNKELFYNRVKKVVIHELGHNLGLPHCPNKGCVMQDAVERISTIDDEGMELCGECRKNVQLPMNNLQ